MNILRWFLALILLGLSSSIAAADAIDPAIGVQGCCDATHWTGSATFTITTANFTSGGFFINTEDANITNFLFSFDTQQGPFTPLEGSAFPTVTTIVPGFEALLSGGTIFPGSPCFEDCASNQIFGPFEFLLEGVTLGPNGQTVVTVTSNVTVPEPATMILMASGFLAIGLRRVRRKKRA